MNLARIRIGFPIIQMDVRIVHSTPRLPTAFERILLVLCDRFGQDARFNTIPLDRIFADVLGVLDPGPVIAPTIQELVSLDVLRCQGDKGSPGALALRDLEITNRGRQMLTENKLPAKARESEKAFVYDPVAKRFLSEAEQMSCFPKPPPVALGDAVFREVFPEDEIRREAVAGGLPGWTASSRIERVERRSGGVLWRESKADLCVDNRQELRVACREPGQTDYVGSLGAEEVMRRILIPAFGIDRLPPHLAEKLPIRSPDEKLSGAQPIPVALADFPGRDRLWFVDASKPWFSLPEQAGAKQVIISLNPSSGPHPVEVRWNLNRDGCIIIVKWAFPLADALTASSKEVVRGFRLRVKLRGEKIELPVAVRQQMPDGLSADILRRVIELLHRFNREEAEIVPSLWQTAPEFWGNSRDRIMKECAEIEEAVSNLRRLKERYSAIHGQLSPEIWDNVVAHVVCGYLKKDASVFASKDAEKIASILAQCDLSNSEGARRVADALITKFKHPNNIEELSRIARTIAKGVPGWRVPWPSDLYTDGVLSDIARRFLDPSMPDVLRGNNAFENAVRALAEIARNAKRLTGGRELAELATESRFLALRQSPAAGRLHAQAELWRRHYTAFLAAYPEMQRHIAGSALSETNNIMERILALLPDSADGVGSRSRSL